MTRFYFITIDKVFSMEQPTRQEYFDLLTDLCVTYAMTLGKYPVRCLEFKKKGNKRQGTLVHTWPHLHCIVSTEREHTRGLKMYKKGYSINVKELHSSLDVLCTAGYIHKFSMDQVELAQHDVQIKVRPTTPPMHTNDYTAYSFLD